MPIYKKMVNNKGILPSTSMATSSAGTGPANQTMPDGALNPTDQGGSNNAPGFEGQQATPRKSILQTVASNITDRWGAGNTGTTVGDRITIRQNDRTKDINQNVANNTAARAKFFENMGMDGAAAIAKARSEAAMGRYDTAATGDPVQNKEDKAEEFAAGVRDTRDLGKYQAYEEDINTWKYGANNFDPTVDASLKGNVANYNVGNESVVGDYYKGREDTALNKLENIGSGDITDVGNQFNALKGQIEGSKTDVEKAIDANDLAAVQGKLTDAGSEWYKNKSALLDYDAKDQENALLESLGASGGIGGGKQDQVLKDFRTKMGLEKANLLSTEQAAEATAARSYVLAQKQNANTFMANIADMVKANNTTALDATKSTVGYLSNVADTEVKQTMAKLNEKQLNLDTAFKEKELELRKQAIRPSLQNGRKNMTWRSARASGRHLRPLSRLKDIVGLRAGTYKRIYGLIR